MSATFCLLPSFLQANNAATLCSVCAQKVCVLNCTLGLSVRLHIGFMSKLHSRFKHETVNWVCEQDCNSVLCKTPYWVCV